MFGLGFWEISVILIIALVVLGPKKLPELAKSLGKGIREFRNATEDFKSTMDSELAKPDRRELPTPPRPPAGPTAASNEVEAEVERVTATDTPKAADSAAPAAAADAASGDAEKPKATETT